MFSTTTATGNARTSGRVAEPESQQRTSSGHPSSWPQSWVQNSELTVYIAKQNLKRKAADGDQPTKYLASEAVSGMGLEARAKLGCQLSSLNRMVQRSRRAIAYVPETITISRYRGSLATTMNTPVSWTSRELLDVTDLKYSACFTDLLTFLIKSMSQNGVHLAWKYQN